MEVPHGLSNPDGVNGFLCPLGLSQLPQGSGQTGGWVMLKFLDDCGDKTRNTIQPGSHTVLSFWIQLTGLTALNLFSDTAMADTCYKLHCQLFFNLMHYIECLAEVFTRHKPSLILSHYIHKLKLI